MSRKWWLLRVSLWKIQISLLKLTEHSLYLVAITNIVEREMATLQRMHRTGPHMKVRPPRQPLDGKPFAKGVILKVLIKKPKKPNSANRKCVLVRLSTGKEMVAYGKICWLDHMRLLLTLHCIILVPGIGHNLQEHNVVLVRCGRLQDVPGVKLKCVRGKYDLPHVIPQQTTKWSWD